MSRSPVKLADLQDASGVSTATIKYYVREGLLPRGVKTSATRADYGETHLQRLKLLRALVAAGVPIAQLREIVALIDTPPEGVDLLGAVQSAMTPDPGDVPEPPEVAQLAEELGWPEECLPARHALAQALRGMADAGLPMPLDRLRAYADAMTRVAEVDVATMTENSTTPEEAVTWVVAGTMSSDPVLQALRRLAQGAVAVRAAESVPDEDRRIH